MGKGELGKEENQDADVCRFPFPAWTHLFLPRICPLFQGRHLVPPDCTEQVFLSPLGKCPIASVISYILQTQAMQRQLLPLEGPYSILALK